MELKDRIAFVRKAAGLSQEQLGELLGVTRQAVSKWESGQATPDAVTVARLCRALHVSADFVLLGKEPEDGASAEEARDIPAFCLCCGREVSGSFCPVCGFPLPSRPPRGPRYAVAALSLAYTGREDHVAELVKYCGFSEEAAKAVLTQYRESSTRFLLGRNLSDAAAQWMTSHLDPDYFTDLRIVEDCGEENDDALLTKKAAMERPPSALPKSGGIGFWGVVGAVIVALLILSFF